MKTLKKEIIKIGRFWECDMPLVSSLFKHM